jgi:hypothetical protein
MFSLRWELLIKKDWAESPISSCSTVFRMKATFNKVRNTDSALSSLVC